MQNKVLHITNKSNIEINKLNKDKINHKKYFKTK